MSKAGAKKRYRVVKIEGRYHFQHGAGKEWTDAMIVLDRAIVNRMVKDMREHGTHVLDCG